MYAIQWTRSLLFIILMYVGMAGYAIIYFPWALASRNGAYAAIHGYCRFVRFIAHHLVGLRTEVRGVVPTEECLVAAKHQSFLDIILITGVLPKPKLIMKAILKWAPFLGFYAVRIGCVPVNRGRRGHAMKQMVEHVKKGLSAPGQLVIFPQGTRVAAGAVRPYKIGAGVLYTELDQPCYPAATNVGVFWPRRGIYRKPGLAVVEFLPPILPGQTLEPFMPELEATLESHSNRLMAEAGFKL